MYPILFKAGPVTFYTYGFCVAVAIAAGAVFLKFLMRNTAAPKNAAFDILFFGVFFGLAGARLFYVTQHWPDYQERLVAIFYFQEGGFVWYGGFAGSVLSTWIIARRSQKPLFFWADLFSPILPLAHSIGRVGCFLNGCCYGKSGVPVQLMEAAFLTLLSVMLYFIFLRRLRSGAVFACYLLGYGVIRFALEFYRQDQALFLNLTIPQWISAAIMLWAFFIIKGLKKNA